MQEAILIDSLSEVDRFTLRNIIKALEVKQQILSATQTKTPSLYVGSSGYVRINLDLRSRSDYQEIVHLLAKTLKTTFNKERGINGFLRFTAVVNGIPVFCNTKDCFYGGTPIIEEHPRTKAVCPVKQEVSG